MESVNNVDTLNVHMKNAPLNIGVIIPPDKHFRPVLYSHEKATQDFNKINYDIYEGVQKSKKLNEKKTPFLIKMLAGAGVLYAGFLGVKKLIKR